MTYWYYVRLQINQIALLTAWVIIVLGFGRYFGQVEWRFSNVATLSFVVTKIFLGAFLRYKYSNLYSHQVESLNKIEIL